MDFSLYFFLNFYLTQSSSNKERNQKPSELVLFRNKRQSTLKDFSELLPSFQKKDGDKQLHRLHRLPTLRSNILPDLKETNEKNLKFIDKLNEKASNKSLKKKPSIFNFLQPQKSQLTLETPLSKKNEEKLSLLLETSEWKQKSLNYEDLIQMDDNEIIGLMSNFNGLLFIWRKGILDMKEKFVLWEGSNEKIGLKIYQKSIIWHILPFKSKNFNKVGLEENLLLKNILTVYSEITSATLEFIWNFLCIFDFLEG